MVLVAEEVDRSGQIQGPRSVDWAEDYIWEVRGEEGDIGQ